MGVEEALHGPQSLPLIKGVTLGTFLSTVGYFYSALINLGSKKQKSRSWEEWKLVTLQLFDQQKAQHNRSPFPPTMKFLMLIVHIDQRPTKAANGS